MGWVGVSRRITVQWWLKSFMNIKIGGKMWAGMIGCCFDCKLKIVRQACAVHVGGAPRSLCPAGGLRRFHARSLPMLECECCHLSLNLQELDLDSNFFTYLFTTQCFHDSARRKSLGKIFRLSCAKSFYWFWECPPPSYIIMFGVASDWVVIEVFWLSHTEY